MGNAFGSSTVHGNKLDRLLAEIDKLHKIRIGLEQRRKELIEALLLYGTAFYFAIVAVLYVFRSGINSKYTFLCCAIYPALLFSLKHSITWFFNLRLNNTSRKLNCLTSTQQKIMCKMRPGNSRIERDQNSKAGVGCSRVARGENSESYPSFMTERGILEKVFCIISGESDSSWRALICSLCRTNNGRTLKEEYDYTSFKCFVCQRYNPAKKVRPVCPKLITRLPG